MERTSLADELRIQRQPQSQDALATQLRELHIIAARVGLYDAADWLWKSASLGTCSGVPAERR